MKRRVLLSATAATLAGPRAWAQGRPVSILVGYAAGGAVDVVARIIADRLRVDLNQQVVIDNRPGASGVTAAIALRRAAPDGTTLGIGTNGTMVINPHLMRTPPFNPVTDFTPIGVAAINDGVIVVHPDFPAHDLAEFIATVKAAPDRYFFASSGIGGSTHLAAELVKQVVGLQMNHVPYQGDGPALIDVIAGRVPILVTVMPSVADHIRSGRVRAIVALGDRRFPGFPDLPIIAETYPGLNASAWLALFGPKGMPDALVRTINAALHATLADPATLRKLADVGSIGRAGTPEALQALVVADLAKWKTVIDRIGLEPS